MWFGLGTDVPYAPAPGRDDRTPVAFLSHVFGLDDGGLPEKLTGIGPVFWDHAGHGTGALIAPDIVLTTAHLFTERGKWDGPYGPTNKPPAPSDGRIYLEACGQAYGPGAKELILSSSAATLMFALRGDWESCLDCSRRLGIQTLAYDDTLAQQRAVHARNQALHSLIGGGDPMQAAFAVSQHNFEQTHQTKQRRDLQTPDEIMNMRNDRAYLFHEDVSYPIEIERRPFWLSRELAGLYHPNPYFPPLDRVTVQTRWGQRTRRVITESVPERFAHLPQYRHGMWSRVEM
ncbi:hypothetical protein RKLH11_1681 [Rhodobacteraceae bacterium KLH11]|nr:hypothetical protein RKLH11_1681 [Rhodobacteraceae bacterium KLH11]